MPQAQYGLVGHRKWPRIKAQWTGYLPDVETAPSLLAIDSINDVIRVADIELPPGSGDSIEVADIPAVRTSLFAEAAFDMFAACSTISAAERAVERGSTTIGVSLGYYALLFASRAWLSLLGLARVEIDSKFYVIDIWPDLGKTTSQGRPIVWAPKLMITKAERFEHDFHWKMAVFVAQRTFDFGVEVKFSELLRRFGASHSFSRRRNAFLYRRRWQYDDLLADWFAPHVGLVDSLSVLEFDDLDLDLKVGQLACCAVFNGFEEIAAQSANTKKVATEIKTSLNIARHPIMFRGSLLPMLTRLTA